MVALKLKKNTKNYYIVSTENYDFNICKCKLISTYVLKSLHLQQRILV